MRTPILFLLSALAPIAMTASHTEKIPLKKVYQYRLYLTDKAHNSYSLRRPQEFLSQKSIDRRKRQGLRVDSTDLPVSPAYLSRLQSLGLKIMGTSRWHNTVWVESATDDVADRVGQLPFVRKSLRLYVSPDSIDVPTRYTVAKIRPDSACTGYYGRGQSQIDILGGRRLHDGGFRGKGMTIAILDAGFQNADAMPAFSNVNITATKDCAPHRTNDIYAEHYHGTMVLSTMAMNKPGIMVGTAPEASYILIRTEDIPTETRAEEDAWTMGVEYADSIGADIINSSLGYSHWDGDSIGPQLRDLDGHTTFISSTASMIAGKGMVLCSSAGNEGASTWHKISIPADADDILTVGSVKRDSTISVFSSLGPSQDQRVKPDVCALGGPATVVDGYGELTDNFGTSFASPIMCGMVACLWQANPSLTACQVIELVRSLGDRFQYPDNVYGYGIPNFSKAPVETRR